MILIAVFAPVIIMAVLLAGAAVLAMLVVVAAALGGLVVSATETVAYAVIRRRAARNYRDEAMAAEWPPPTAEPEFAFGLEPSAEPVVIDEPMPDLVPVEAPVLVTALVAEAELSAYAGGFPSWEEMFFDYEPDFEELDEYTDGYALSAEST